jgi:hypothetical protein
LIKAGFVLLSPSSRVETSPGVPEGEAAACRSYTIYL